MGTKKKKDVKTGKVGRDEPLVPKSVGGVKLPKDVRGKLAELAKHPIVADLLAAGLVALAARIKDEPKVRKGVARASDDAGDAAHKTASIAGELAAAVAAPLLRRAREAGAAPPERSPATSTAPAPPAPESPKPRPVKRKPAAKKGPTARRAPSPEGGVAAGPPRRSANSEKAAKPDPEGV